MACDKMTLTGWSSRIILHHRRDRHHALEALAPQVEGHWLQLPLLIKFILLTCSVDEDVHVLSPQLRPTG